MWINEKWEVWERQSVWQDWRNCVLEQSSYDVSICNSWTTNFFSLLYLCPRMLWRREAHFMVLWTTKKKSLDLNLSDCFHISEQFTLFFQLKISKVKLDVRWRFGSYDIFHPVRNAMFSLPLMSFILHSHTPLLLQGWELHLKETWVISVYRKCIFRLSN